MITKVAIKNFRGIREAEFELGRINLIVGPNASGKTSVLDALNLLSFCMTYPPNRIFGGWNDRRQLRSRDASGGFRVSVDVRDGDKRAHITFLENSDAQSDNIGSLLLHSAQSDPVIIDYSEEDPDKYLEEVAAHPASELMRGAKLLQLDPKNLAKPSVSEEAEPRVQPNGLGLAAALAELAISDPQNLKRVEEALQAVVPSVRRLHLRRSKVISKSEGSHFIPGSASDAFSVIPLGHSESRDIWGHRVEFDFHGANSIPSYAASEGCLLTLGLLAVMLGPDSPELILLDELERGLHPSALKELVLQLKRILKGDDKIQIIATTHSPYLVDHFEPEEILVTGISQDGSCNIAPLKNHPDFKKWAKEMSPGEFWTSVGEEWVGHQ